jgi:hypothetical protein
MPAGVTCLTCDYSTTGPQSLQASFHASYGKMSELPCDVMYTVHNAGWGDWAPRPRAGLEQTGVTIWAHGCKPYLGDRLHPTNRLDPLSVRAIRFMGEVQDRVAAAFPDPDAEQPNEILVVTGPAAQYGPDLRAFAHDHSGLVPVEGMHRLLLDAGYPMAIVSEDLLPRHLGRARVVVLAECRGLGAGPAAALRQFVEAGGRLLVSGCIPEVAGAAIDWLGVTRDATPWQDHIYLPLWAEDPDKSPVLVHGPFHRLRLAGGERVLRAIQPYDCSFGMRFGHATGPVSFAPSAESALVRHGVGRGEVWYLEAPIGSDYYHKANLWQADWLRGLLERVLPQPTARVVSEAGSVEIVPHVSAAATWAFLINHGGEQLSFSQRTARTSAVVPPYPITVELRIPAGRIPGPAALDGEPVEGTVAGQVLRFDLIAERLWAVLKVVWD